MRRYIKFFSLLLFLSVCTPYSALAAQTCNTNMASLTPTDQFTDNGNGTVTDNETGLMWKQCLEGATYSAGTCTGSPTATNWAGALSLIQNHTGFAGHTDWRLPNIKELQSIVEEQCYSPSINLDLFPDTPSAQVWSNSPYAGSPSTQTWYVSFDQGDMLPDLTSSSYNVRLVRDVSN